jgi:hypothetical protein
MAHFERNMLDVFLQYFNLLTPVAPYTLLRDALCIKLRWSLPTEQSAGVRARSSALKTPSESNYAALATLWACVASGAAMTRSPHAADYYIVAKEYLSRCYDSPCYETMCALAATAIAAYYISPEAFAQYANFAMTIYREVRSTLSDLRATQLRVTMSYLSCTVQSVSSMEQQKIEKVDSSFQKIDKPGSLDEQLHQYAVCGLVEIPTTPETDKDQYTDAESQQLMTLYRIIGSLWNAFHECDENNDALKRVLYECSRLRSEGFCDKICHVKWLRGLFAMFAYCTLGYFEEARQEAEEMLSTMLIFPHLATMYRKGSVVHMALVSALLHVRS